MLRKAITLLGLLVVSVTATAEPVIEGVIASGSGALIGLAPPGTDYAGDLDWNGGALDGALVTLGAFCFTDDASGLAPIVAPDCGALAAVPLLTTGQAVYDGTPAAPGSTFQQAGTTYDGVSGVIRLVAFSPTFNANLNIDLTFVGDGTGTALADGGFLGNATGPFTVSVTIPPVVRPPGDPNAIPVMPLSGLILTGAALALVAHRRLRKLIGQK